MRDWHRLAIGATAALLIDILGSPAWAQAPALERAKDSNPLVVDCNPMADTIPDPNDAKRRLARPITSELLTVAQPCQQKVSGDGPLPNNRLGNLQRGFDFYSWLTFIALNSPADGKTIGQGPRPGGDAPTKWEALENYRPLADVMLADGSKPTWRTRDVPEHCQKLDAPGRIILRLGEAAWNQPFKTGPLIDQNGNYALFDILMNQPMFEYIADHALYNKEGQEKFDQVIKFPSGITPSDGSPGKMGAVMVKVSWRILDRDSDKNLINQFHTADALIYFPGPPMTKTGPACVTKTLGLVGFHVGHKTDGAPQWVWSSFEHISNVPDQTEVDAGALLSRYNFFSKTCKHCPTNQTPPDPWDPPASLKFHSEYRSQVVRVNMLPAPVIAEVADLNRRFHAILKGTVWENYMLLTTQWPSDFKCTHQEDGKKLVDPSCAPAPTYLANSTLESYSQGQVPLASSSCMACHGNATSQHQPATPSDFTFILEKAQSSAHQ
jgi:hypothetical protein